MKHLNKKLACVIMTALLMIGMILPAAAVETPIVISANLPAAWNGTVATAFAGGTGTEADPYLISNAQELALIASNVNNSTTDYNGVYFKQTADINLAGAAWTAIGCGKSVSAFKGVYDGANYTIHNLLNVPIDPADETDMIYNGLFGHIEGATIQNVKLVGGSITSSKYAGAVVGYMVGGTVYNCVSDMEFVTGWQIGGIVGRAEKGDNNIIKGCVNHTKVYSYADKESSNAFVGGIIGGAGNTEIHYCANYGEITANKATSYSVAGGIIGIQGASSAAVMISNCMDMGVVTAYNGAKNVGAGGICGKAAHVSFSDITNCFTAGTYTCDKEGYAGGIAGFTDTSKIVTMDNLYTTFAKAAGTDALDQLAFTVILKEDEMKGADGITRMKLDSAWVAESDMLPSIDVTKIAAAEQGGATETTTTTTEATTVTTTTTTEATTTTSVEETTTDAPETTTAAPEETEPTASTTAPAGNEPTQPVETRNNMPLIIVLIVAIVIVIGCMVGVLVVSKKKS